MSKNKNETLYEKTMRQLKNNPIVVGILVLGAIAVGLSQGLDIFKKVKETVSPAKPYVPQITEVQITLQPYNIVTGYTASPTIRSLNMENNVEIDAIANSILEQISEVTQPGSESGFRANLEIKDNVLNSDQSLEGGVIVMNSVAQVPARVKIDDLNKGVDLTDVFSDSATFDQQCSCIHVELHVPAGGFQNVTLEIYQVQKDGYSFDPASSLTRKTLDFTVATVSILIETPKGEGSDAASLSTLEARLNNSLRQQASDIKSLELSPYPSLSDLRAVIDPLIPSIAPGGGKGNVLEQYRVDYIITINFIMK